MITAKYVYEQLIRMNYCSKYNPMRNCYGIDFCKTLYPTFMRVKGMGQSEEDMEIQRKLPNVRLYDEQVGFWLRRKYWLTLENGERIHDEGGFAKKIYEYCN